MIYSWSVHFVYVEDKLLTLQMNVRPHLKIMSTGSKKQVTIQNIDDSCLLHNRLAMEFNPYKTVKRLVNPILIGFPKKVRWTRTQFRYYQAMHISQDFQTLRFNIQYSALTRLFRIPLQAWTLHPVSEAFCFTPELLIWKMDHTIFNKGILKT